MTHRYSRAERAWILYDWANSSFVTTVVAAVLPAYFAGVVCRSEHVVLHIGSSVFSANPQSLWGYSMAFAAFVIAISAPILGAAADSSGNKKLFLGVFTITGVAASALLFFSTTGMVFFTLALLVLGMVGFSGANIFYNSVLVSITPPERRALVSSRGFAFGYLGGGLLLAFNLFMIKQPDFFGFDGASTAIRFSFLSVAVWWAVFSIPLFRNIPKEKARSGRDFIVSVKSGFQNLLITFRSIRKHSNAFRFLLSFLLYNDGIQTIIMMATIFGKSELGLATGDLIGALLVTQFVGFPGSILYGKLAVRIGAKKAILFGILSYIAVIVYAWKMTQTWQFWVLATAVGLLQGGIQAVSRAFYSVLIPPERSSEYFGFFAISSRFASILGPFLFAFIGDVTGSTRNSIISIALFFLAGGILLLYVREPDCV